MFRLAARKRVPSPSQKGGPHARAGSPPGGSTLTTRAPRSPSTCEQKGPARFCVLSQTEMSDSGAMRCLPMREPAGPRREARAGTSSAPARGATGPRGCGPGGRPGARRGRGPAASARGGGVCPGGILPFGLSPEERLREWRTPGSVCIFMRHYGMIIDRRRTRRDQSSMETTPSTVVLAYSGGLDTACILRTLIERGHEVIAYVAGRGSAGGLRRHLGPGALDGCLGGRRRRPEAGVRHRLHLPRDRRQCGLREPLSARHLARPARDREGPGRDRARDGGRLGWARRDGEGQRPGALRARLRGAPRPSSR